MEFRVVPVRPRRRFRTAVMAFAMLLAVIPSMTVADIVNPGAVESADAYTWGAWSPWYYKPISRGPGSRDDECDFAAAATSTFIGPLQYAFVGCRQAIRWRKANVDTTTWTDRWIEIDNVGPMGGYGMKLRALVSYNGTLVKAQAPICNEWAYIVTITREACSILNNNTGALFLRMDYKASWTFLWANVQAGRGAQAMVDRNGVVSNIIKWP